MCAIPSACPPLEIPLHVVFVRSRCSLPVSVGSSRQQSVTIESYKIIEEEDEE